MDPSTQHTISRGEIEHVLKCLRYIDQACRKLEAGGVEKSVTDEIRKSADGIYSVLRDRPHVGRW